MSDDQNDDYYTKKRRGAATNVGVVCVAAAIIGATAGGFAGDVAGLAQSAFLGGVGVLIINESTKPPED